MPNKSSASRPKSGKQIATGMKPSVKGARKRSISDLAKMTPADASGKTQIGRNIFAMGRDSK
jgi:hypothetical protein